MADHRGSVMACRALDARSREMKWGPDGRHPGPVGVLNAEVRRPKHPKALGKCDKERTR